jgi:hypothetical protein
MSIYHLHISNVSRSKGSSAIRTLSYITGKRIYDERLGQTVNYGRKERVDYFETALPVSAPAEHEDSAVLFNSLELFEKNGNARLAKRCNAALPRELSKEQQREVCRSLATFFTAKGYPTTWAIHLDKDGSNPHVHFLVANRQLDQEGHWIKAKNKKAYALDEAGNRIPLIDERSGEQKLGKRNEKLWKRISVSANWLDQKEMVGQVRELWALENNRFLDEEHQIDCRSFKTRKIELTPTVHEGYAAREIQARGGISEVCQRNETIREMNRLTLLLKESKARLAALNEQMTNAINKLGEEVKDANRKAREAIGRVKIAIGQHDRTLQSGRRVSVSVDRALGENRGAVERANQAIAGIDRDNSRTGSRDYEAEEAASMDDRRLPLASGGVSRDRDDDLEL